MSDRLDQLKRAAGLPSEPQGSAFDMLGRQTPGDPLPPLPRPEAPAPNDEDRKASAEDPHHRSPLYFAEMRVTTDLPGWERARAEEDERQRAAQAAREAAAARQARQG